MAYDFQAFTKRAEEITNWLQGEFTGVRTGQATPALLDGVRVESYGTMMPINQVATVNIEDARTLRISVWDAGQVKAAEKAITDADLGLSIVVDDKGLRVVFPELTGERREQLVKVAKGKLEDARVQLRSARDEAMKRIETELQSEDEKFRAKEDLQKRVDGANEKLQSMFAAKESEIKK